MYLQLILICLLQFVVSNSKESGCGCNINREQITNKIQEEIDGEGSNGEGHCPTGYESEELGSIFHPKHGIDGMILVPGGDYQVGTDDVVIESDKEGPKRIVNVQSFYLDKYEVSNRDFSHFVTATKHKTEAETFGDSFVFEMFLNSTFKEELRDFRVVDTMWWYKVSAADWKHPFGPDSDLADLLDHPVVHVSWNDAKAYCKWRGARLPSEAEWEAACRGGHRDTKYPWGDKLFPGKQHMANIWQGTFPMKNSAKDGYVYTSPVTMFPPNDFGLYNMAGNVWEWTEDTWRKDKPNEKVKKGGSYLCHASYCYRYRCSARSQNTDDTSAGNLGFRCAKSIK